MIGVSVNMFCFDGVSRLTGLMQTGLTGTDFFTRVCDILRDLLSSSCALLLSDGTVFCSVVSDGCPGPDLGGKLENAVALRMLDVLSVQENIKFDRFGISDPDQSFCIVCPVYVCGKRMGTMLVYRKDVSFDVDDLVVCDCASIAVGFEMNRSFQDEAALAAKMDQDIREAFRVLTVAETEAVIALLKHINGASDSVLAISYLSDDLGYSRSVMVSGLRKLSYSGMIHYISMGRNGTRLIVRNPRLFEIAEQIDNDLRDAIAVVDTMFQSGRMQDL